MFFMDEHLKAIAKRLAETMVLLSFNSSHALLVLWDAIYHSYYKIDLQILVDLIDDNLFYSRNTTGVSP